MKDRIIPIFIVGCGRSGTTLLRLILNRHSRLAFPEETWFFPQLVGEMPLLLQGEWRKNVARRIHELNRIGFPDLTIPALEEVLAKINATDIPSIVACVNLEYMSRTGKDRWGDKTPGYVMHLPLIKRLYPEAKVIHMVRDGRDVIPSILKYWSVGPQTNSLLETAHYWKEQVATGLKQGPLCFKENYVQIKYEDLVEHPEIMIKKICQFIDEQFEPQMLDSSNQPNDVTLNWEWHSETKRDINTTNIGKWRKTLSEYDLRIIEIVGRDVFVSLGYPLQSKNIVRAWRDVVCHEFMLRKDRSILKVKVGILKILIFFRMKK